MYVVLDGYDLGVGMLTLTERDVKARRELIEVVATAWDGNETWLILFGVTLFGGLPTAYGVALPALYVPIVVMLLALVFRGAAIERVSSTVGVPRGWGLAFGVGSLVAAFAQGVTIGGALSGIAVTNGQFSGGTFDFMTSFALLTGVTTVVIYGAAGAAYVQLKTTGAVAGTGRVVGPSAYSGHRRSHARLRDAVGAIDTGAHRCGGEGGDGARGYRRGRGAGRSRRIAVGVRPSPGRASDDRARRGRGIRPGGTGIGVLPDCSAARPHRGSGQGAGRHTELPDDRVDPQSSGVAVFQLVHASSLPREVPRSVGALRPWSDRAASPRGGLQPGSTPTASRAETEGAALGRKPYVDRCRDPDCRSQRRGLQPKAQPAKSLRSSRWC